MMTKCKIEISTNRSFDQQDDARIYLRKLVDAGVLFIHSYNYGDKTKVTVNETTYYQTQETAMVGLKRFVDAGILYLEVERDQ